MWGSCAPRACFHVGGGREQRVEQDDEDTASSVPRPLPADQRLGK